MRKRSRLVLPVPQYKNLLNKVFNRDGWRCRIPGCGRRHDLHGHHIVYRSQGGDDIEENLLTVCNHCHEAIHNRYILIEPEKDGEPINANGKLKYKFLAGWRPGWAPKKAA